MNLPVGDLPRPCRSTKPRPRLPGGSRAAIWRPTTSAALARDEVQMRPAENGGDPSQTAVPSMSDLDSLFAEFKANGLKKGALPTSALNNATAPRGRCLRRRARRFSIFEVSGRPVR